jgi:hypothetical protein
MTGSLWSVFRSYRSALGVGSCFFFHSSGPPVASLLSLVYDNFCTHCKEIA